MCCVALTIAVIFALQYLFSDPSGIPEGSRCGVIQF